jgi:acyl carrier protein
MADLQTRVRNCFALAFPELSPDEISSASMASVASWDSVAGITLLSLIEEEFGVSVPADDVADMVSFELILNYLARTQSDS